MHTRRCHYWNQFSKWWIKPVYHIWMSCWTNQGGTFTWIEIWLLNIECRSWILNIEFEYWIWVLNLNFEFEYLTLLIVDLLPHSGISWYIWVIWCMHNSRYNAGPVEVLIWMHQWRYYSWIYWGMIWIHFTWYIWVSYRRNKGETFVWNEW